jgi:hypothetical protein
MALLDPSGLSGSWGLQWVAMTHGAFLSVAAVFAILAAVFALAVLSSLALRTDGLSGRRAVALFWGCLGGRGCWPS